MKDNFDIAELLNINFTPRSPELVVCWYVRAEQEWARLAEIKRLSDLLGEDGPFLMPNEQTRMYQIEGWMNWAKPNLPEWFVPGRVENIREEFEGLFGAITDTLNRTIEKRRAKGIEHFYDDPVLNERQKTLEYARILIYKFWGNVRKRNRME